LFVVRILCWRRIHAKILHFGSACAFQIGWELFFASSQELYPVRTLCGVLSVWCPLLFDFIVHVFHSVNCSHSFPKWDERMEFVHWLNRRYMWDPFILYHSFAYCYIFPFCFLEKVGCKMYFGACPLTQFECQQLTLSPLPTVMTVEALKRSLSVLSQGVSSPTQGRVGWCHLIHSQHSRKARAKRSKSKIPKLPKSRGAHVVGQFTRQWPPLTFSGSPLP
jgi:hypothetical protein